MFLQLRENQSDFQLRKTTIIKDRKILDKLAKEFNCQFDYISSQEKDDVNLDVKHDPPKLEDLVPRPPVVAIVVNISLFSLHSTMNIFRIYLPLTFK